mgnify:CR=1 FL=1
MNTNMQMGSSNGTPGLRMGSAPGVDSLQQTPQTVTQRPGHGIHSNHIINRHYLMSSNGIADQLIDTGQLVFIRKTESKVRAVAKTHTLLNLAMLNYHLYDDAGKNTPKYTSVKDILDNWSLQGVVVNTQGGQSSHTRQSRIMNLTVGGWSNTLNLWGQLGDGDSLYFTLVKVTLRGGTKFRFNTNLQKEVKTDTPCYQFIPRKQPWFLEETDERFLTQQRDIVSLPIGRVFRSTRMTSLQEPQARITRDVPMMIKAPQFEFLVNIKRPRLDD